MVFNKIDRLGSPAQPDGIAARYPNTVFVSARDGEGIEELKAAIAQSALRKRVVLTLELGAENAGIISDIYRDATILETRESGDSVTLTVSIPRSLAQKHGLLNNT